MPANTDLETAVSPPYFADPATPPLSSDLRMFYGIRRRGFH